jgi:hypothetical protein
MTGTAEHSAEFSGSVCLHGRRSPAEVNLECTENEAVSEAAKEAANIAPYESINKI